MLPITRIVLVLTFVQSIGLCFAEKKSETVFKPRGVYASSGYRSAQLLESSARGVLVRVRWNELEPEAGKFDFSAIERQRKPIVEAGKKWSLAVLAGRAAPEWLQSAPYSAKTMKIRARTRAGYQEVEIPRYWDPVLQTRLRELAKALGAKYDGDASLVLVYVPQMNSNGVEGHFNANTSQALKDEGLTADRWVAAAKGAAVSFAQGFPHKAIAFEVHEVLGSADIPKKIINDLWNDPKLSHRVGCAVWWLSGRDNYQGALLKVLKEFPGDIYAQAIGRSDQPHRFGNRRYASIFKQAKELGVRYIEVWEYEFKKGKFSAEIADFNGYADDLK